MTIAAKRRCSEGIENIRALFLSSGQAMPALKERTGIVDSVVLEAFASAFPQPPPGGMTVLAVGGYGRRELFPSSDVDLTLLVRRPIEDPTAKGQLSEFLRLLWDSGLRASHSVRTVEECCAIHEGNFELTVSLLDQRFLGGDQGLYGTLRERFGRFLAAEQRDLTRRLCRLSRSRHSRFHDTIYRLEPDVKESPGGLRDIQTTRWLRQLRGEDRVELRDPRPLQFLAQVRLFLHFLRNRDANTLDFEAQDAIAAAPFSPWHDPAEWMRQYFRNASAIFREALFDLEAGESQDRSLLTNFRDWRSRLSNSEFTVSRDLVFLRNPHMLEADPELALRLYLFVARHGVAPARQTESRVTDRLLDWQRHFSRDPVPVTFWRDLLSRPHSVIALRSMAECGLLRVLMPEWERIEHLVVRDFYHHYTVDEHTLVALDVVDGIASRSEAADPQFAQLAQEAGADLWLLRFALLLHDIGKGSGRDHSLEAVRMAKEILTRAKAAEVDIQTVEFLIQEHLLLSSFLQGKDMNDPETAKAVAQRIKTVERFRLLALLTFADISAVNPAAMNAWRKEQLWRLYRIGSHALSVRLSESSSSTPRDAYGELSTELAEFLAGLPDRYFWTHTRALAEQDAALYRKAVDSGSAVSLERRDGVHLLTVVGPDRPFLFASLAGALASFGCNILKADAYSNAAGAVVDRFAFDDPHHNLDLNPPELERLKSMMGRVARGEVRVEDLLKNRPVRKPPGLGGGIAPTVTSLQDANAKATVFEVIAQDRPGLLYQLASAISRAECNIEVVLVDTEAHKAIDVFHVTRDRKILAPEAASFLREALLAACLG